MLEYISQKYFAVIAKCAAIVAMFVAPNDVHQNFLQSRYNQIEYHTEAPYAQNRLSTIGICAAITFDWLLEDVYKLYKQSYITNYDTIDEFHAARILFYYVMADYFLPKVLEEIQDLSTTDAQSKLFAKLYFKYQSTFAEFLKLQMVMQPHVIGVKTDASKLEYFDINNAYYDANRRALPPNQTFNTDNQKLHTFIISHFKESNASSKILYSARFFKLKGKDDFNMQNLFKLTKSYMDKVLFIQKNPKNLNKAQIVGKMNYIHSLSLYMYFKAAFKQANPKLSFKEYIGLKNTDKLKRILIFRNIFKIKAIEPKVYYKNSGLIIQTAPVGTQYKDNKVVLYIDDPKHVIRLRDFADHLTSSLDEFKKEIQTLGIENAMQSRFLSY